MKLPSMSEIKISYISRFDNPDIINKFMRESVAEGTQIFRFSTYNGLNYSQCQTYLEGIHKVANKITQCLDLSSFRMDRQEFK